MRNLVVHCNPHTRTHTYAGEKFKCFLCPRKDHPAKKIFQEQYTIQRETCRFFILSSRSPRETRQNEKGSTLCDYDLSLSLSLSLSYRLNAKSWNTRGGERVAFQAGSRDTPSNQEPISGGNYCVLGHLNANLVTLHSLVYNASKRGWDPFIGILFPAS